MLHKIGRSTLRLQTVVHYLFITYMDDYAAISSSKRKGLGKDDLLLSLDDQVDKKNKLPEIPTTMYVICHLPHEVTNIHRGEKTAQQNNNTR